MALITTAAAAAVALSVITRALESHLAAQVVNAAALVGQSDFALNPAILRSVQAITGAEVITYNRDGRILAATTDAVARPALVAAAMSPAETAAALAAPTSTPLVKRTTCESPCLVARKRVAGRGDTVVAVVAETTDIEIATHAVTRAIILSSVLGLVVMGLVSQLVARRVTRPLEKLVAFAQHVAGGDVHERAPTGPDEIGRLGAAFNDMLQRLDASQAALVRSEKLALAGTLAARIAHDVRNPLSSIKMQSQLLRARTRGDADSQALAAAVLHDVDMVESVVRGLLELAHPGDLARRPAALNDVVTDVLRHLQPQLTHSRIRIESSLHPALPPVFLDVNRFRQAVINIVVNAMEAMPAGGTLTVITRPAADGAGVELEVCDDGVGIDPALRDRVFDAFVSSKRDGVGLGLLNARTVIESHGGAVELHPRSPKGTRATVRLPIETPHARHG